MEALRNARKVVRNGALASTAIGVAAVLAVLVLLPLGPTGCGGCDLDISTGPLPDGVVGTAYGFGLHSRCGGDDGWFVTDGSLPPGIGLIQDGFLRGTPTVAGTFNFTVEVINFDNGDSAFKGLQLTVTAAP